MLSAEMLSWILGARRFTSIARICDSRTPVTVTSCNSSSDNALAVPDLAFLASAEVVVGPSACAESGAPAFSADVPVLADAMADVVAAASNAMDIAMDRGCLRYTFDTAFPSRTVVHAPLASSKWRHQVPRLSISMTDGRSHLIPSRVYLFGRLTNQSRTMFGLGQVYVALPANTAMIVRIDDESNE